MVVDDELRRLIAHSADVAAMRAHAVSNCGLVPLRQDALAKAARGVTSLEEVIRVAG